jgi:hypothetical protein
MLADFTDKCFIPLQIRNPHFGIRILLAVACEDTSDGKRN